MRLALVLAASGLAAVALLPSLVTTPGGRSLIALAAVGVALGLLLARPARSKAPATEFEVVAG